MLDERRVGEMILTIFRLVLGKGIPRYSPGATRYLLKTVGCETYATGLIQWRLVRG